MSILQTIVAHKKEEVAELHRRTDPASLRDAALASPPARGFASAIRGKRAPGVQRIANATIPLRVIAEIKRASPSAGLIRPDFDAPALAAAYERAGASAISCLTDEKFFQGSLEIFRAVRAATSLPMLRKEFIIDPLQIWEARAAGADAILLIAGMVDASLQQQLRETAREAGLDVLLEIHAEDELEPALTLGPDVLGINNRNLRTRDLATDLATTHSIAPRVPGNLTLISESGIRNRGDIAELSALGIDGVLVGEQLMRQPDPGAAIYDLLGLGRPAIRTFSDAGAH